MSLVVTAVASSGSTAQPIIGAPAHPGEGLEEALQQVLGGTFDMERAILFISASERPDYELAKIYHLQGDRANAQSYQQLAVSSARDLGWDQQYLHVIGQMPLAAVIAQQSASVRRECDRVDG